MFVKKYPPAPNRPGEVRRAEVVGRLQGKVSKQDANYRVGDKGSKQLCGECVHYLSPSQSTSSCRRVAGPVAAEDTCDLFAARAVEGNVPGAAQSPQHIVHINMNKGKNG